MTDTKLPELPESVEFVVVEGDSRDMTCRSKEKLYTADQMRAYAITHAASLQAKIDALMLEYCPDDMTPEQMQTWAAHQVPSSAAKAEAIRQSQSLPAGAVALREALVQAHAWFEDQSDAISKGCGSTWDLLQVREQRDLAAAALQADAREKGEAVCFGLRRKGETAIIGVIPHKVHAVKATSEEFLSGYEEVPLYARPEQAATGDEAMAMHWIDRYAAGIDEEPQMDRIREALAAQPAQASEKARGEATGDTTTFKDAWARLSPIDRTVISIYFQETHPQPVTPAGGEVERALSEAATVAAIHSQYPATTEYDQGYGAGRKDAAMAIRDLAKTYTHPPVADAALSNAYDVGWIECTNWAKRDDLVSDMDSPAYAEDRARNLAALNQQGGV